MGWLGSGVRQWFALVGGIATVATVVGFALTTRYALAWVAIGLALSLAGGFALAARDEHRRRLRADEATHQPPGGGIPIAPPVEYQVTALRQVIKRLAEVMDEFGYFELSETLKNLPRRGADPVYEPLSGLSCDEGLARLVELGELKAIHDNAWRIVKG